MSAGPSGAEALDVDGLACAMSADDVGLQPLTEEHRAALKAACAEDLDIWQIYSTPFGPEHFDNSFDLIRSRPTWRCFAVYSGERLVGMTCFIGIDADRGVL